MSTAVSHGLPAPHILIVEDDAGISEPLNAFLRAKHLRSSVAASAEAAIGLLRREQIDLLLLDVMLPGESGWALCKRLRANGGPRIIMMTALSDATDKVAGLELGADDYVAKPFDVEELLARIRAVLRRPVSDGGGLPRLSPETVLRFAGFAFHPYGRFLRSPGGLRIQLTSAEADLLLVFCQHPRKTLSREELADLTRSESTSATTRSIDLKVSRLRRKLGMGDRLLNIIHTVRADGYAFQAEVMPE